MYFEIGSDAPFRLCVLVDLADGVLSMRTPLLLCWAPRWDSTIGRMHNVNCVLNGPAPNSVDKQKLIDIHKWQCFRKLSFECCAWPNNSARRNSTSSRRPLLASAALPPEYGRPLWWTKNAAAKSITVILAAGTPKVRASCPAEEKKTTHRAAYLICFGRIAVHTAKRSRDLYAIITSVPRERLHGLLNWALPTTLIGTHI